MQLFSEQRAIVPGYGSERYLVTFYEVLSTAAGLLVWHLDLHRQISEKNVSTKQGSGYLRKKGKVIYLSDRHYGEVGSDQGEVKAYTQHLLMLFLYVLYVYYMYTV